MKVTIKDIADKLDIDMSSVSYALSGKGTIKPETRELVRKTAEEMGYVANGIARKVSTGKSNLVGIVMPNVLFAYGEYVQHGFRMLSDAGMETSVSLTEFTMEREEMAVKYLLENRASGLIIKSLFSRWADIPEGHPLRLAAKNKLPVVSFGYPISGSPFGCVHIDMFGIGKILGRRFADTGRKNVKLLIPHPPPFYRNVKELLKGLEEAGSGNYEVSTAHFKPDKSVDEKTSYPFSQYDIQLNEFLSEAGLKAGGAMMRKLLSENEIPDAIVCLSENNLMGVYNEAARNGIEIPGRMALASPERSLILSLAPIPITSASVSMKSAAEASVSMLLDLMKGKDGAPQTVSLEPEFYSGASA
ncbi:MAG TPA: hypothetical protein DCZ94_18330 [Lentisphaeria bacterium]|nr:MAG: hypothetical protein A2X48_22855 [Lentisphaerae bacterium GWF2_49_21]HBC88904.1 hypothetical protein [Lentisphaeria bacterium]